MAGAAAIVTIDNDGLCRNARLAFCGVADRPWHADDAARSLHGSAPTGNALKQAAELAMRATNSAGACTPAAAISGISLACADEARALAVAAT
jgi:CO/xanthine dehydrogenase FAD-binding subunit